jgi:hypothetical protein
MKNYSGWLPGTSFSRYPTPPSLIFPARNRRLATAYQPRSPQRRQRSVVPAFCQQLDEQRIASRESTRIFIINLIKLLLAFSPLLLATQWYLTTTADKYAQEVANAKAAHHMLIENRTALESLSERLSSPERIRNMAAEKLSLHSPAKGQIEIF